MHNNNIKQTSHWTALKVICNKWQISFCRLSDMILPGNICVLTVYWQCTDSVLRVYWQCTDSLLTVCLQCTDSVLRVYWQCAESVLTVCWECADSVLTLCWQCADNVLTVYWQCADSVLTEYWQWQCNCAATMALHIAIIYSWCNSPFSRITDTCQDVALCFGATCCDVFDKQSTSIFRIKQSTAAFLD